MKMLYKLKRWWNKPKKSYPEKSVFYHDYKGYCGVRRLKIGDFVFSKACYLHDREYEKAIGYKQKLKADILFFKRMLNAAFNEKNILKCFGYFILSIVFFVFVLVFGFFTFRRGRGRGI